MNFIYERHKQYDLRNQNKEYVPDRSGEPALHLAMVYESPPFQYPWEGLGITGYASCM